jgi:hypothetical protein
LFGKSCAGPPRWIQSADSIADKSGQFHRKSADFLLQHFRPAAFVICRTTSAQALATAAALGCGSDARRHLAAGLHLPGGQSFAQKQKPGSCSRALHLLITLKRMRYFTEATLPNWLSKGL